VGRYHPVARSSSDPALARVRCRRQSAATIARALRGETITPGLDFIHTADDGRETWIRVSAAPFCNETDEIVGAVAILQDVNEEKRAERQLRENRARLRSVMEATARILRAS
jgi:PAS domain-containing protein